MMTRFHSVFKELCLQCSTTAPSDDISDNIRLMRQCVRFLKNTKKCLFVEEKCAGVISINNLNNPNPYLKPNTPIIQRSEIGVQTLESQLQPDPQHLLNESQSVNQDMHSDDFDTATNSANQRKIEELRDLLTLSELNAKK